MIRDIAIYGAGGFGRETALMIDQINREERQWKLIGFFDDGLPAGTEVDGHRVVGGLSELNAAGALSLAVAIADPRTRSKVVSEISNKAVEFTTLVHPNCLVGSESNYFGQGCILTARTTLTTGIVLGDFVIVNLHVTIGHDVKIGSFTTVMPGVNISGNVTINEGSLVGTGAQILQSLQIGKRCRVGAGAVVTKSFPDDCTLIGVPARKR